MKDHLLVGALSFTVTLATAWWLPGCSSHPYECPTTEERPEESELPLERVQTYTSEGMEAPNAIDPLNGVMTLTPEQLVITYESDGAAYEVVYDVIPTSMRWSD